MQMASGRAFWPLDPHAREVCIFDIAHALAHQCRYGGHCRTFYSVAQHSVYVSRLVPPEDALCGLLHDATEAYCVDVPRPVKVALKGYKEIEQRIWLAIAERFWLPEEMPQAVHDADVAMLFLEQDQVMYPTPSSDLDWGMGLTTPIKADFVIDCLPPEAAKKQFLDRFNELFIRRLYGSAVI